MAARSYAPAFPLKHQQKDMRLALALGDQLGQAMPTAAAANELYKEVGVRRGRGRGLCGPRGPSLPGWAPNGLACRWPG